MPVRQHPTDLWGVPEGLFGPVPDEFYAVVGRVTMLAALVDDMLLRLAWSLTDEIQSVHSRKFGDALEKVCRSAVARFPDKLASDVIAALDDIHETRQLRNDVVHSVWPSPTLEAAFAWRAVDPAKNGGQPTKTFETNGAALGELVAALVSQISRLDDLQQRGHTQKAMLSAAH